MGENVMSQKEIDDLMASLLSGVYTGAGSAGDSEEGGVKEYDFKHPDKFSKDQIRTLLMLHETFSRYLNTHLSGQLRTIVNLEVGSIEQMTYQEFVQTLPSPSVMGILDMSPLKGTVLLTLDVGVAFAYIDHIYGGDGSSSVKKRVLTEIEEITIKNFIINVNSILKDVWANVIQLSPELKAIEYIPLFAQVVPPSDMVIAITINMQIDKLKGKMHFCIPYLVLEPIMFKLTTSYWVASSKPSYEVDPAQSITVQHKLEKTKVPVSVEVGTTDITIRDFLSLRFGDVLQLNKGAKEELCCLIGDKPKFYCRPGVLRKNIAVQITRLMTEDEVLRERGDYTDD